MYIKSQILRTCSTETLDANITREHSNSLELARLSNGGWSTNLQKG